MGMRPALVVLSGSALGALVLASCYGGPCNPEGPLEPGCPCPYADPRQCDGGSLDAGARDAAPPIDADVHDTGRDASASVDASTQDTALDDVTSIDLVDTGPDAASCDPPPLLTVRAFYDAWYGAFCAYYARCVPGLTLFGGATSCTDLYASEAEGTVDAMQALVDSGRTRFDATQAAACVARLACAECGALEDAVYACTAPDVLAGTLDDGAACTTDYECSGGACDDALGCGNAGTCHRQPTVGEACTTGGIRCRLPAFCSAGVCTTFPAYAPGDPCPAGSCSGELQCWGGVCHNPFDGMHLALGQACSTYGPDQCSVGLVCTSSSASVCEATLLPLGAACAPANEDPCGIGGYCDGTTCVALPTGGQACHDGAWCAVGFACRCPSDATCAFADEVCTAMHHLAEACTTNGSCWSGSCVGGVCVAHEVCD